MIYTPAKTHASAKTEMFDKRPVDGNIHEIVLYYVICVISLTQSLFGRGDDKKKNQHNKKN